jgi:hypothetical protein
MAKAKQIAHGTSVLNNTTTLTLIGSIDPPPRKRALIDGRDMADAFDVPLLGIEERSEWSLEEYWQPGDTEDEAFDTAFGAKTELTMKIVTPHTVPKTDSIPSKVVGIEPQTLTPDGLYKRKINFVRTGAITRT